MAGECVCGDGIGELGLFDCSNVAGLGVRDIFQTTYDVDGVKNGIVLATDFDLQADGSYKLPNDYVVDQLDADSLSRWGVTPLATAQASARTEDNDFTDSSGGIHSMSNSVITVSYEWLKVPFGFADKFVNCTDLSVYQVLEDGGMLCEASADGTIAYPLRIQKNSLKVRNFLKTPEKPAYVSVSYQLSKLADESKFMLIKPSEITADLLEAKSVSSAEIVQSATANTATVLTVRLQSTFEGTFPTRELVSGATVTGDWTVLDGLASVTVTGVVELASGEYEVSITSTAATDLTVSYATTRTSELTSGYVAPATTITTP